MHGPAPKPASKRRRTNTPVSYGAATAVTARAAGGKTRDLGFDVPVHKLVQSMWNALQVSCESTFYSEADFERARFELYYANMALMTGRPIGGATWAVIQDGLNALLISPAEKRRVGVEVRPVGPDKDEDAAVSLMSRYRDKVKSD